jgi:hypothetical protein
MLHRGLRVNSIPIGFIEVEIMIISVAADYDEVLKVLREHSLSLTVTLYPDGVQLHDVRSEISNESYRWVLDDFDDMTDCLVAKLQELGEDVERFRRNKPQNVIVRGLRKLVNLLEKP